MSKLNHVSIIGYVGKKPVEFETKNGAKGVHFRVATHLTLSRGRTQTIWHNVTAYGSHGLACAKYLDKGSLCYIEGRLRHFHFIKDDVTFYSCEVISRSVEFLRSKAMPDTQTLDESEPIDVSALMPEAMQAAEASVVENIPF